MKALQTGQKIAQLRARANMTQEQLAEKLFVSRELISKWETGKSNPDHKMLMKTAEIFSVGIDELFDKEKIFEEELSSCIPDDGFTDEKRLKTEIDRFLETLSVRDRAVFIRRYFFLEEVSEIGTEYEIKEDYVRTILMRTRKKLKKYLKGVNL